MSPSWPGFYEGAIFTAEEVAKDVSGLLKEEAVSHALPSEGAWALPRSHTLRLVTSFKGAVETPLTTPELN